MRRLLPALAGLVLLVAGALWWSQRSGPAVVRVEDAPPPPPPPAFATIDVRAPSAQGLTLTGVVRGADGAPVPGAEVSLAASDQPTLTSVRCGHCQEALLSCRARETVNTVVALLDAHQGDQRAALVAMADGQGRFRFEGLAGTSFTLWGTAPGHGVGVKERAAPGDPAELFLPAPRELRGQVKDEAGAPVRATVRAISRRLAQVERVETDETGRFLLDALGEGPFFVVATSPGGLPAFRNEVQAGAEPITLTMLRPRTIEVRLLTVDRRPIEGQVQLAGDHLQREITAREGLAVIPGLAPGPLLVSASAKELSAGPQQVTLSAPVTQVTLVLERGGRLAVTVVDEAEQPVPSPTVELLTTRGEPVQKRVLQTGELAVLGPIAPGDYQVRARADGFTTAQVPAKVVATEAPLELVLTRGTALAGRVSDEYGRPAPGVSVLVMPLGESVISGPDGRFRTVVPSPGLYSLQAHHSDWGGGELKVTAPREDVELQLEPRAGCEVTVTVDGRRLEGASAMLFTSEGNYRSDRVSGADGVVLMRGMPPGTYTVVATHPGFLAADRQSVKLDEGQLVKVSAELKRGATITGRVVDGLGAPVGGVTVAVSPRNTEPVVSDGTGNFSLGPLRPNTVFTVRVTSRGYEQPDSVSATAGGQPVTVTVRRQAIFRGRVLGNGQPLRRFRVESHDVVSSDGTFELPLPASDERVILTVEASGYEPLHTQRPRAPELGDFDLKPTPQLTGIVRDEAGQAVADAVVSCESCEQPVLTGPDGRFSISRPPLQHEFTLAARKGRRTGARVVVGEVNSGLEVTLKPATTLVGTVWLPDGRPAGGVEVQGVHAERNETVSAVTGADGAFSLDAAPGVYRFSVSGGGFPRVGVDPLALIAEVSGTTSRLDIGAAPGTASITVRLRPMRGYALWLVRGEPGPIGHPPLELLRSSWAQMIFQPLGDRVVLNGLTPGRYTLVWSSFHAADGALPVRLPVDVPSQAEISLVPSQPAGGPDRGGLY